MKKSFLYVIGVFAIGTVLMSGSCGKKNTKNDAKTTEVKVNPIDSSSAGNAAIRVAYYNVDSLNENYQLVKDVSADIERKIKSKSSSFEAEVKRFETWATDMEKKMRNGELLSKEEKQFAEQFQKRQMELAKKEQQLGAEIQEMQMSELTRASNRVNAFVKAYALEHGYDMIFQYQMGGQIIYINEAFDVSEDIINGLNEEYKTTSEELSK
jgi:outer membrane protein